MSDLVCLVRSEIEDISDLLIPLCLLWFSQPHREYNSNTEIAKYLLV